MAIAYQAPVRKADRKRRKPQPGRPPVVLGAILAYEEAYHVRIGDPCPEHGDTHQSRFGRSWHWQCCGRTVTEAAA